LSALNYPNLYNFVRADLDSTVGELFIRRYSYERGGFWASDNMTYRNAPNGIYSFRRIAVQTNSADRTRPENMKKVLFLENDKRWHRQIRNILPKDRYELEIVDSYERGVQRLQERGYDLVIANLCLEDEETVGGMLDFEGELILQDMEDLDPRPPCVVLTGNSIDTRGIFQRYPWVYTVYTKGLGFNSTEFRNILMTAIDQRRAE
jgi:CheY-like chemotaxis protein